MKAYIQTQICEEHPLLALICAPGLIFALVYDQSAMFMCLCTPLYVNLYMSSYTRQEFVRIFIIIFFFVFAVTKLEEQPLFFSTVSQKSYCLDYYEKLPDHPNTTTLHWTTLK